MPVLIMFRSLTYAQRAFRALERAGIASSVTKAPIKTTDNGCTYCIRLGAHHLQDAMIILDNQGIHHGRILRVDGQDEFREIFP